MANSFHRSGRAPMVSPDEAFRSAQSRASRLAQQRRQAARRAHNSPNPAHKKGNISNSKSSSRPVKNNPSLSTPSSKTHASSAQKAPQKAPQKDSQKAPKPSAMPSSIPPRKTPKDDTTRPQKSTQRVARSKNTTQKRTPSHPEKTKDENITPNKGSSSHKRESSSQSRTSSRGKHAKKKDSAQGISSFFSSKKKTHSDNAHSPARKSTEKESSYTDTNQTTFPAVSQKSYFPPSNLDEGKDVNSDSSDKVKNNNDFNKEDDSSHTKDKKKKKHSWFSRKSKAQVSTDLEDKNYDTISSSDDLEEVKEKAHLSQRDADKILDTYDDYKVKQQVRSNGRKVEKLPRIYVVIPRKKKFFKVITSIWAFILIIALAALCVYGYSVYNEAEMGKEKDAAYAEGVKSSGKDPDISSLMKMNTQQLSSKILASQGANFPNNATVDTFSLAGWTYPGGTQKESKAEIDFCYAGDGQKRSQGSVFFYTPDAVSTNPEWTVDTISLTQTPCGG